MIRNEKPKGKKRSLTQEQIDWLVSTETLQSMSHLSLRKRIPIVRRELGLETLQHNTLRSYYLKYGVKSIKPDYSYYKSMAEQRSLQEKQMEFAG